MADNIGNDLGITDELAVSMVKEAIKSVMRKIIENVMKQWKAYILQHGEQPSRKQIAEMVDRAFRETSEN